MGARDYHEDLWEAIPEGLEPSHLKRRLAFLLAAVAPGERVLDVGCGEGRFTAQLAHAQVEVVGIDVAEEPLRRARKRYPELDLRLITESQRWPFEDSSFDIVWAGEVIEHVADTAGWLSEVRRVLPSGGRLLLSTPNHTRLRALWLAVSGRAFDAHFDPLGDHLRFYTPRTMRRLLSDFGFEEVRIGGTGATLGLHPVMLVRARRSRF